MGSYSQAISGELRNDWKDAVIVVIFTLARIYFGYSWLTSGWEKLSWLTDGKANSAGLIKGMIANLVGPKVTRFDPLGINHLFGWLSQNIFLPMPGVTDFLVVFFEIILGLAFILGFQIAWSAFIAFFLNIQYITAGSFNNFGYLWTDLIMFKFARYFEVIGLSGFLRYKKERNLI